MSAKTKWVIDPAHSEIGFRVKHLMITNIKGTFKEYDATVYTSGNDFTTADIDFWLNPASIDTKDANRDGHLRQADFFDTDKFPRVTFKANHLNKIDEENYELNGELSIRGISKPVKLNVEYAGIAKDPWGNEKAGFVITGKINRSDWGLTWNAALETGGVLVSEVVNINCEVQLKKGE